VRERFGPEYFVMGLGEPGHKFIRRALSSAFSTPMVTLMDAALFGLAELHLRARCHSGREHRPALVVCWGINPNHTSGSRRRETFSAAMKAGAKLVTIDPRKTDVAALADLWIKPRPGSDGALALGILKVVVERNVYHREFVAGWTVGFEQLQAHLRTFTLADVERVTWVPQQQIRKFAALLGELKPACIQWGNALDQGGNSFQLHRAISICASPGT
jgi:anaerobic selenocysteine-containing dehydrogenase